jgi:hypothetical protein
MPLTGVRALNGGHNVALVDTFTGCRAPHRLMDSSAVRAMTCAFRGPRHAGPSLDGVPPSAIRGHAKRTGGD